MRIGSQGLTPPPGGSPVVSLTRKRGHISIHHHHSNHYGSLTTKRQRFHAESLRLTQTPSTTHAHGSFYLSEQRTRKHHKTKKRRRRSSAKSEHSRDWVYATRDCSSYQDKVVLVSYNILGVENASKHPDLYSDIPEEFLVWNQRKKLICKEINRYSPSILCFQEVDRFNDLQNVLQKDGFQGIYQARSGEACDGCAIFWKNETFSLLHQENIIFESFGLRNNVAQLCVLKMNQNKSDDGVDTQTSGASPSRSLVVGNIHVLFNPSRGDIKLGQVRLFLEKAHKLSQKWGRIPVVIAGDFNSVPKSAMYQYLASSKLDVPQHDRKNISGQMCPPDYSATQFHHTNRASFCMKFPRSFMHRWSGEELRLATGSERVSHLVHHLKLQSAYAGVHGSIRTRDNLGEPLATSYHSKFMGTVDYIWHTDDLVSIRVVETLPTDVLRKTGGLPSKKWGSDHLALVCELAFADVTDT